MSLRHYDHYLIGGKHQKVVEEVLLEFKRWMRGINTLKRKYKCEGVLTNSFGLERTLVAVKFSTPPDPKIWRRVYKEDFRDTYYPRQNTVAGRVVYSEFQACRKWTGEKVAESVGYKWLFYKDSVFPFNAGMHHKKKIMYFQVPSIPEQEETPKDWYKPVPGVKKISYKKLTELVGGKP